MGGNDQVRAYMAYHDRNGPRSAVFIKRNLRQYPIHFGVSVFRISEYNKDLMEKAGQFMDAVEITSMVGIEFKYDIRNNSWVLLDVNPRMTGSVQHAIGCGIDLPWIYYCDMTGDPIQHASNYRSGFRHTRFHLDLGSFFHSYKEREITLMQFISSYRGKLLHQIFAWDDLRPFLATYSRFMKMCMKKVLACGHRRGSI